MKNIIYYFTGTGNNLNLAKKLQNELGDTEIEPIRSLKEHKEEVQNYEKVIFCVPSYHSHIPQYVSTCLSEVKLTEEQKVYTIIGCGGNRGRAVEDLRECIEKCGSKVIGEFMVMYPGNYILKYNAFPKIYQKIVCDIAERKIKGIAKKIKNNTAGCLKNYGLFYSEKYEDRLQKAIRNYSDIGKNYTVSNECIGCGICEQVCPVKNISINERKPVFGDNCQQCMACIQWCPKRAIDYKDIAGKRKLYHHRNIAIRDMIQGNK